MTHNYYMLSEARDCEGIYIYSMADLEWTAASTPPLTPKPKWRNYYTLKFVLRIMV